MAEAEAKQEDQGGKMPLWAKVSGKLTVGSIAGYMAGNFFKQITDEMIMYSGMAVILIGGLHWMRWITINWRQIDKDVLGLVQRAKVQNERGAFEKVKRFLIRTIPLLGGFGTGFYYGFTNG